MNEQRPNVSEELARLKDFQRLTAEYAFEQLWHGPHHRFLVADEVGLGKTLVARGIVAKTIDHLWDSTRRIDIIYVCANSRLAQQNLARLNVGNYERPPVRRLGLLATATATLDEHRVNILSLTPGTSFDLRSSEGISEERIVLHQMLESGLGRRLRGKGWVEFFRAGMQVDNYRSSFHARQSQLDEAIREQFLQLAAQNGTTGEPLLAAAARCADRMSRCSGMNLVNARKEAVKLIGTMRALLATASVAALEPDLIILDEFQRFHELLSQDGERSEIAQTLFSFEDVRLLLLSATPYAMYTLPEPGIADDHYHEFAWLIGTLSNTSSRERASELLAIMRDAMLPGGDARSGESAKRELELLLRELMCRTERLGITQDREGMLAAPTLDPLLPRKRELRVLRETQRIAKEVDAADPFEYWRSVPYPLSFLDDYDVGRRCKRNLAAGNRRLGRELEKSVAQLPVHRIETYQKVDSGNAKMGALVSLLRSRGAFDVAWIPASLPYYEPTGAFRNAKDLTKVLVFSAWTAVPRAIATMVSYEFDQVHAQRGDEYRKPWTALLTWRILDGAAAATSLIPLVFPLPALAALGDPLAILRDACTESQSDVDCLALAELRRRVREKLQAAADFEPGSGASDSRWYWVAPLLLEPDLSQLVENLRKVPAGDLDELVPGGVRAHLDQAANVANELPSMGGFPADLWDILTDLAIAAPGVCALRTLQRKAPSLDALDLAQRAFRVANRLRSLFNRREIAAMLRSDGNPDYYRRLALQHCLDGNLQAVLDEYAHMVCELAGLIDVTDDERASKLAEVIADAVTTQTANPRVIRYTRTGNRVRPAGVSIRSHIAVRYGRERDTEAVEQTEIGLQRSFNSPWWPFVLATTSVGQEGLDFHAYCHAVMHWNLPSNPVDFEQREGRVHRYKGHVIRRNVALDHRNAALRSTCPDPWEALFEAASRTRPPGANELVPYWVYPKPDAYHIERYVPAFPLSKESIQYENLVRSVGAYRLTLGQPRQSELLKYSAGADLSWAELDLSPRPLD